MPDGLGLDEANTMAVRKHADFSTPLADSFGVGSRAAKAMSIAPSVRARIPPDVPRLGKISNLIFGTMTEKSLLSSRIAFSAIPVPPMRYVTTSPANTALGAALEIKTTTLSHLIERNTKPHDICRPQHLRLGRHY